MSILSSKHILLGVTGSIAGYKAVDLASKLTQAGAVLDVILTPAAEKFVSPITFQSVTGRKAYCEEDLWGGEAHILHVGLGKEADILVIAPATANTIAKLAHGMADNLLTITALASQCPVIIAPAMDADMYQNPSTQDNIRILSQRGVTFAGPGEGRLASGLFGEGRFLDPGEIIGYISFVLGKKGRLAGKKVVISAGGTQEPIDPVRVITNKSSGKQGYALAQASVEAGGSVVLISTPTGLNPPIGAQLVSVHSADEMKEAVIKEMEGADALVMAAAVSDFRPKNIAKDKIKKVKGIPNIELEPAPDILEMVSKMETKRPKVVVGFAAESQNLLENAGIKLQSKKLDIIVANDISQADSGFGVDTNRVTLLFADGKKNILPLMRKDEVAEVVVEQIIELLSNK